MGIKNRVKKLLLTGALVTTCTTSIIGCSLKDNYQSQSDSPSKTIESVYEYQNANTSNNQIGAPINNTTYGNNYSQSFNYKLYYNNISMDTVITPEMMEYMDISRENNNADRRLQTGTFTPINIKIDDTSLSEFIKKVDSQDVIYKYEEYYNIDEALARTGAKAVSKHTYMICDINEIPSEDLLYKIVLENNQKYLKENPKLDKLSNQTIKKAVSIIIDSLKDNYDILTEDSKKRVYCFLGNLKIVGIDSADKQVNPSGNIINAMMCSDGAMFIDEYQINLLKDPEAFEKTCRHEAEHIYQKSCIDNTTDDFTQVGISQTWENEKMNPLTWKFSFEGSAELNTMYEHETNTALIYTNFVRYTQALDFVISINPDYGHNTMEILNANQDIEGLYKSFGAETIEEKKEIISMLYAIDHLQIYRNDFVENYETLTGNTYNDDETVCSIKSSIMQSLTKYFYKNLAQAIAENNLSIQDIFYLINVFESDINSHIIFDVYSNKMKEETINEFAQKYIGIQNTFFETIAKNNNIKFEDLSKKFQEYSLVFYNGDNYIRNAELIWMTQNEQNLASNLLTKNIKYVTSNIRETFDEEGYRK